MNALVNYTIQRIILKTTQAYLGGLDLYFRGRLLPAYIVRVPRDRRERITLARNVFTSAFIPYLISFVLSFFV